MGKKLTLTASDGFKLGAYRADPTGKPKGALVVIQEIFGVNNHIRALTDKFAGMGYVAIAPQVFDRITPDFESGYTPDEIAKARGMIPKVDWTGMMADVQAAINEVKDAGKVGIVGYCMGGTVAFLAAGKLEGLSAAVGYYGGQIAKNVDLKPKVPTQLHFGEKDESIPMSDVATIKDKRSDCDIYVYDGAAHGFACDERGSFKAGDAKVAEERTMKWFEKYLAA